MKRTHVYTAHAFITDDPVVNVEIRNIRSISAVEARLYVHQAFPHLTVSHVDEDPLEDLRVEQLRAMHELMKASNDEAIYAEWIEEGAPDEPDDEMLAYIAQSDERWNEIVNLFTELINDGGVWA